MREHGVEIEMIAPSALRPRARNARTHSKKQVRQIADSIAAFGFTNPVLIDDDLTILAGHGRVAAARSLGMARVPCRRIAGMSEDEKRAYVLADNKLALNAGWDEELLAAELDALLESDFEINLTGFSIPEIDALIEGDGPEDPSDPRDDAICADAPASCSPGDLWALGPHRLICGDARDAAVVDRLMGGARARMVFTDPPYNVRIAGNASPTARHGEFAMASGEMSASDFTAFLSDSCRQLARVSVDGAIHFICMDWRHMAEMRAAGDGVYAEMKNLIVWVKDNGGMGSFYRSQHELIFVFKVGTSAHLNTFGLGETGRHRTNVWRYRGANSFSSDARDALSLHPTAKPVQMIADAIKDVSGRGDILLDLFGGSGSTLIAAAKTGRCGYLCEFDPTYCDGILARWSAWAHDDPKLLERREPTAA
ncbi:MAG: DNA methyltransferase [Pseudomonadota bacterium]